MCKVIFLDIDGVLNSMNFYDRLKAEGVPASETHYVLDPKATDVLAKVVQSTGAWIVVSSTWRMHEKHMGYLTKHLQSFGLSIADVTPHLNTERGDEIKAWLEKHPDVTAYAILDDDSDMGDLMPHLVQTSFQTGLQRTHALKLMELLNSKVMSP